MALLVQSEKELKKSITATTKAWSLAPLVKRQLLGWLQEIADTKKELSEKHEMLEKTKMLEAFGMIWPCFDQLSWMWKPSSCQFGDFWAEEGEDVLGAVLGSQVALHLCF